LYQFLGDIEKNFRFKVFISDISDISWSKNAEATFEEKSQMKNISLKKIKIAFQLTLDQNCNIVMGTVVNPALSCLLEGHKWNLYGLYNPFNKILKNKIGLGT